MLEIGSACWSAVPHADIARTQTICHGDDAPPIWLPASARVGPDFQARTDWPCSSELPLTSGLMVNFAQRPARLHSPGSDWKAALPSGLRSSAPPGVRPPPVV